MHISCLLHGDAVRVLLSWDRTTPYQKETALLCVFALAIMTTAVLVTRGPALLSACMPAHVLQTKHCGGLVPYASTTGTIAGLQLLMWLPCVPRRV